MPITVPGDGPYLSAIDCSGQKLIVFRPFPNLAPD
jgi:hypothetical protein